MKSPEQFYHDLEEVLEQTPGTIKGTESLSELNWDSMATVIFIAMADEKYSVAIAPSKLAEATTVADLLSLLPTA